MTRYTYWLVGLLLLLTLAGPGCMQPGMSAVPPAPGLAPPPQPTIWGFLGLSKANLAECQAKLCVSPAGQLLNNSLMPVSALTGGLVGPCCPAAPGQLGPLPAPGTAAGTAASTAAAIQKSEADAKAYRAAIRYLSTVDCRYWPEAETSLIQGLRYPNECVRLDAARALGRGCCCTKKTIAALTLVVNGSEADGNPAERSECVKLAALESLDHCLACFSEVSVPPPPRPPEPPAGDPGPPEKPPGAKDGEGAPASAAAGQFQAYFARVASRPSRDVVADARRAVESASGPPTDLPPGNRSVLGMLTWTLAGAPQAGADRPIRPVAAATQSAPTQGGVASAVPTSGPADRPPRSLAELWPWRNIRTPPKEPRPGGTTIAVQPGKP